MKNYFNKLLRWKLRVLARWTIKKYQPGIMGVTGSVGKTSAKEAIYAVLRSIRRVRVSAGNFNNEIGLPLTVLGDWQYVGGFWFWVRVILASCWRLVYPVKYPEILILEYGADRPGDIRYLLDIARPQIGIVTAVGEIPVHLEFYSGPEAVAKEKARLVESLPANGFTVLNFDDPVVLEMKEKTRAHALTFGFGDGAEVRITNFENRWNNGRPEGVAFKLECAGSFVPLRINGCLGKPQAYAAAAAACVGLAFGMNLVRIVEALHYYKSPPHRLKVISGIKNSFIIDDTYNASLLSMQGALESVRDVKKRRRVGILGDMLEIGKYSIQAHETIGRLAGKTLNILITIGPHAKFIAAAANKVGLAKKNIFSFDRVEDALAEVNKLVRKNDLILVKASRAIGLGKIVDNIRQSQ
ncbi:MAG: UDP-N-acetylmuramoyl-tripeptide--D-alanyl-D-alanine ligase [bacterium]|nr:UDP-N-acetylmuramoyl-tripeptide--D-alanyl-D-alanine ligase [bacterium]